SGHWGRAGHRPQRGRTQRGRERARRPATSSPGRGWKSWLASGKGGSEADADVEEEAPGGWLRRHLHARSHGLVGEVVHLWVVALVGRDGEQVVGRDADAHPARLVA